MHSFMTSENGMQESILKKSMRSCISNDVSKEDIYNNLGIRFRSFLDDPDDDALTEDEDSI